MMTSSPHAQVCKQERAALAATLLEVGPAAPTLCEGWNSQDLLFHLLIREQRPYLYAPGMGAARRRHQAALAQRPYESLVAEYAAGPYGVFKLADALLNTAENFVHHEDLRRAGNEWTPRDLNPDYQQALYAATKRMAPVLLAKQPQPVVIEPDGLPRFVAVNRRGVAARGNNVLHVRGDIAEILLWAFGREDSARPVLYL